jgi:hypothetical protein
VVAFLALRLLGLVVCWQVICIFVWNNHFEWRLWKRSAEAEAQNLLDRLMIPIPPCGGCSWGSFSGIEWTIPHTIPQLTNNQRCWEGSITLLCVFVS